MAAAILHSSPHDLGAMAERLGSAGLLSSAFWCNEVIIGRCVTFEPWVSEHSCGTFGREEL